MSDVAIVTPKLNKVGLQQVWSLILENFVNKGVLTDELIAKLENMDANGQENVIESISVNGTTCEITEKGISLTIPTGTLADLDEVGTENLSTALAALINGKADKATTLAGYGITDAYTKSEADNAISTAVGQAVAGVYKIKGSVAFASLPSLTSGDVKEGYIYNVTDAFTTNSDFKEGAGLSYPAGTNVVVIDTAEKDSGTHNYMWDCQAGTYDFSDFMMKDDLVDITEAEINAICVVP